MAKYTELLAEYLQNGNTLPSVFSQIEGFEDLFKQYYIDKEIGFETEYLFSLKLDMYAKLYVPIYAQRISDLATAITGARNPIKTFYDSGSTTLGEQDSSITELPYNASTSLPSSKTHSDQTINSNVNTRTESGRSVSEAYFVIDELNKKVNVLTLELLKEFKNCFMAVM